MFPVGFETTISAEERSQTYALDRAATGTGYTHCTSIEFLIHLCEITSKLLRQDQWKFRCSVVSQGRSWSTEGKQRMGIRNYIIGIVSRKEGRECLVSGRYQGIPEPTRNDSCQSRNRHLTPLHGYKSSGTEQAEEHTSATAISTIIYISYKAWYPLVIFASDYSIYVVMCRLTTGIRSEKCVFRRFCHCANIIITELTTHRCILIGYFNNSNFSMHE
jgi:hypothetical protein